MQGHAQAEQARRRLTVLSVTTRLSVDNVLMSLLSFFSTWERKRIGIASKIGGKGEEGTAGLALTRYPGTK